ncbi:MAG: amidohydrolase family protein [Flavobacteriales bacterium]|nr:amidohydrolase family protein [Flavobacteriales bacterium]
MLLHLCGWMQQSPAPIQSKSILILGGTAHLGNGKVIKDAAIAFENGKITFVKNLLLQNVDTLKFDVVLYTKNKHIYPGFIATNSTLGLMEVGAVRATLDYKEVGKYNPNARTITSFNTDSRIIPTVRTNGILIGQISPRGGIISGTSSVVQFDAWNWEDALINLDEGLHMKWPRYRVIKGSDKRYAENLEQLNVFFDKAKAYSFAETAEKDLKLEAIKSVFTADKRVYINANNVRQLKDIITFKKKYNIQRLSIVGGKQSILIPELLRENKISILLSRVHSLPQYRQDDIHNTYKAATILSNENVEFCFQNAGDMEQMQTRNLPFLAGTAVAYGLDYELAIKALTQTPAKILGLKNYGELKVGYSATLFISEGDALDIITNKVTHAFIDGRQLDLVNEQEKNYLKYKKKYNLKN